MCRPRSRLRLRLHRFSHGLVVLWAAFSLQWMQLPPDAFSFGEECIMACSLTGDRSCCCTARETAEHSKHESHPSISRPEVKAPGSACPTLATSVHEQRSSGKQLLQTRVGVASEQVASSWVVATDQTEVNRQPVDFSALPRPPPRICFA